MVFSGGRSYSRARQSRPSPTPGALPTAPVAALSWEGQSIESRDLRVSGFPLACHLPKAISWTTPELRHTTDSWRPDYRQPALAPHWVRLSQGQHWIACKENSPDPFPAIPSAVPSAVPTCLVLALVLISSFCFSLLLIYKLPGPKSHTATKLKLKLKVKSPKILLTMSTGNSQQRWGPNHSYSKSPPQECAPTNTFPSHHTRVWRLIHMTSPQSG